MRYWLIASKESVLGWYSNQKRVILRSSTSSLPYAQIWNRREGRLSDPLISFHTGDATRYMYAENQYVDYPGVLDNHGGGNVFCNQGI